MPNDNDLFTGVNTESAEVEMPPEWVSSPDNGSDVLNDSFELSPEEVAKVENELFLPSGSYRWSEGNMSVRRNFIPDDKSPSDKSPEGRLVYNFSGMVEAVDGSRIGRYNGFGISPDARLAKTEAYRDQMDFLTQNWAKATRLFFDKHERKPTTVGEVLQMLAQGLYYMYITRGKNGGNYLGNFTNM